MCNYIAPLRQDNSNLKKGEDVKVKILDVRIIRNANWGSKRDVTLIEIVFETECNHIVVKKVPYSFEYTSDINLIYEAVTGDSIDDKKGFKLSEILDKTIEATVDKYLHRGYEGTTLIDFR